MATTIFVDQENGDVGAMISKDLVKLSCSSKSLSRKGVSSFPGKVFGVSEKESKPSRKALGNVNKQVMPQKSVSAHKSEHKRKKMVSLSKTPHVECPPKQTDKDKYPEIEHFFPYDPSDFESFDVSEEHKLSHLCLAGVALVIHENEVSKFETLTNIHLSPIKMPSLNLDPDSLPLLDTVGEITVELPPFSDY